MEWDKERRGANLETWVLKSVELSLNIWYNEWQYGNKSYKKRPE